MDYHPEEFIGMEMQVTQAKNKSLIGISGTILDETKKSFTIRTHKTKTHDSEEKIILKSGAQFTIAGKQVSGEHILSRPEERIKPKR